MARLLSVNVGLPRDIDWRGRVVHTAIWKQAVPARCRVGRRNLEGDGQGDLVGHGGEHRAVFVYQLESYRYWEARLTRSDFTYGQFGENFTVEGLPDDQVCIGDRYQIGSAEFEVTQPRVTCYRVGIRMGEPRMAALLTSSGRPGFYLRVLQEGEVGAGDAITKVGEEPEGMTVAEVSALLYSSSHPAERLERALRIQALSPGWRASFEALLESQKTPGGAGGNAGLVPAAAAHASAPGFRPLEVAQVVRESSDVVSFSLQPTDGRPLTAGLPGQFVVLRLQIEPNGPPLFRSYSLSGAPSSERYRISVKIEPNGAAGTYLGSRVRTGDRLEVSTPRGSFLLQSGEGPVVLLSAGIGATPVLAMLHALVANASAREVWWLHGARNRQSHPFAAESRALLQALPRVRSHILYSRPHAQDRLGQDFDGTGHLEMGVLQRLGVPRHADYYVCGPSAFMRQLTTGLGAWGISPDRIHTEIFSGGEASTPGLVATLARPPHPPIGEPGRGPLISFARSGIATRWNSSAHQSLLELAEACDVPVRWSCRTGVCHSCESGLVSGSVTYEPDPLDPPAEGNLLVCCSQPDGDIVLDL
ncbi:MAG TPA: MOSC and FAD-binding oxidoreductase domain-containing protein [Anaeromyxobacteraceae bacterium]|nr:MOSC and FAD-binding oxidoreductase domain-containing protein [Anaeromyxobacteraceae bacterium]